MKRLSTKVFGLAALTVALCFTTLPAQAQGPGPHGPGPGAMNPEMRERIETVKYLRMIDALDLDKERAAVIGPLMKELDSAFLDFRTQRREIHMKMEDAISGTTLADDKALQGLFKNLQTTQDQFAASVQATMKKIDAACTPVEKVKLLLFQERFARHARDVVRDFRRGGQKDWPRQRWGNNWQGSGDFPQPPNPPEPPMEPEGDDDMGW